MRNGYTKGLVSYGGNRRIFRPQGNPLSSRVSDCLATPLALASSSKSKGAARCIVKDKGSGLIKPIETHLFVNMFRGRTECDVLLPTSAFTGTDRGLLRSVLGPWSPVPKCEAPGAPISMEEHTSMAPSSRKVRILRFKNLPPFRHDRGLQNHV
jgi:hypothetical protein